MSLIKYMIGIVCKLKWFIESLNTKQNGDYFV